MSVFLYYYFYFHKCTFVQTKHIENCSYYPACAWCVCARCCIIHMTGILIEENSFINVLGVFFSIWKKANNLKRVLKALFVSLYLYSRHLFLTHRPLSRFLIVLLIGLRVPTNASWQLMPANMPQMVWLTVYPLHAFIFCRSSFNRNVTLIMLGLDNAGKTATVQGIQGGMVYEWFCMFFMKLCHVYILLLWIFFKHLHLCLFL